MKIRLITLTLHKRSHKYIHCSLNQHKATLMANALSDNLTIGGIVTIFVIDHSTKNGYGSNLYFEMISPEWARQHASPTDADRWLQYALLDAQRGYGHSKAIEFATTLCEKTSERRIPPHPTQGGLV